MHIKQLTSFVTVARTKNMAQTATALNYSHSTVFSHLEALEKEYGAKLYCRTSHGIELTAKGEILLKYAKQMLEIYEESCSVLSESKQTILRVGASESGDVCFMHEILREFIRTIPSAEIEYAKMTTDVSISKLIAGACDVSIVCEADFSPKDLYARYLGTLPLIFVTDPSFLNTIQKQERPALPTLLGTMKMPVANQILRSVGLEFGDHFSALSNIGTLDTIKQLLHYNRGVALLPKMYIKKDLEEGTLVQLPDMRQEVFLEVFVVTASKRVGSLTEALIKLAFDRYNPHFLKSGNILE